jgi:hypothetical protein
MSHTKTNGRLHVACYCQLDNPALDLYSEVDIFNFIWITFCHNKCL